MNGAIGRESHRYDYTYKYTYMASKTITSTEDAYEKLAAHKRVDESFSDVIWRLTTAKADPLDSAGSYPGLGAAVEDARGELETALAGRDRDLSR